MKDALQLLAPAALLVAGAIAFQTLRGDVTAIAKDVREMKAEEITELKSEVKEQRAELHELQLWKADWMGRWGHLIAETPIAN